MSQPGSLHLQQSVTGSRVQPPAAKYMRHCAAASLSRQVKPQYRPRLALYGPCQLAPPPSPPRPHSGLPWGWQYSASKRRRTADLQRSSCWRTDMRCSFSLSVLWPMVQYTGPHTQQPRADLTCHSFCNRVCADIAADPRCTPAQSVQQHARCACSSRHSPQ